MWPFDRTVKAAPVRSPSEAPIQPQVMYLSSGTAVALVQWNDVIAAETAIRHPIIYRALDKIATSVQQIHWYAELDPNASTTEQRDKATFIKNLQSLLDSPNSDMSPAMLRYWMGLNYAAYGKATLKIGFKATDPLMPNGIYPLETKNVYAKINNRGIVGRYEYGTGESKQEYPSLATARPGEAFASQIWKPGFKGYQHRDDANTPLKSVGLPAQVVKALMVRAIQAAEGHPNVRYLVTCSKTLTLAQKQALSEHLNNDYAGEDGIRAGSVPVLQNAGEIEIHTLDNDLSDIHSKTPSDDMARIIFGAYGIPIALAGMGAADGAKFAGNYTESRAAFWQDTIIPGYGEPICQGMTRMLCPPGVRICADWDAVPALMPARIESMASMKDIDFLSNKEKREMFGWTGNGPALPKPPAVVKENTEKLDEA